MTMNLLIVGNIGGTNIGESFLLAAESLGIPAQIVQTSIASHPSKTMNRIRKYFFDKVPANQKKFEELVASNMESFKPNLILVTGCVYLSKYFFDKANTIGAKTSIFLTDDPWNKSLKSRHFIQTLQHYDCVFNPRHLNMKDISRISDKVHYLPFAYCPYLLKKGEVRPVFEDRFKEGFDVFFYGGADSDRCNLMKELKSKQLKVLLAGGYWEKYFPGDPDVIPENLNPAEIQLAVHNSKLALCLVRRANRDEHSMRTYELPYLNACILAEDTSDHRRLFGRENAVCYFGSASELVAGAKELLTHPERREAMKKNCRNLVVINGSNSYADRLKEILRKVEC